MTGIQLQIRVVGSIIAEGNPGDVRTATALCCGIQTAWITLPAHFQGRIEIHDQAIVLAQYADCMLTGVAVRRHEGCTAYQAGIIQEACDVGAATQVFSTAFGIMGQILADAQAHGLAVQNRADPAAVEQAPFQAMSQRDLVVIKDVVLLFAALVIVVNFLVDLAYAWLDPRLRQRA